MALLDKIFGKKEKEEDGILLEKNICLGLSTPKDKYEAIRMAGRLLVESGYVNEEYIEGMIEREDDLTTYLGFGIAIPHGVGEVKKYVNKTGIVFLQFKNGVSFGDEKAYVVVGIAAKNQEHLDILANIATLIEEDDKFEELKVTNDKSFIIKMLKKK